MGYSAMRCLLEGEIDADVFASILEQDELFLGSDEHSFKQQETGRMVTEVDMGRVVGLVRDDRIGTLNGFLSRIPPDRVKEVCLDMEQSARRLAEALPPPGEGGTGSISGRR